MSLKQSVLKELDSYGYSLSKASMCLDDIYSYPISCRLNVFRGEHEKWAIAIEKVGFNPREVSLALEIYFYGNCLVNLVDESNLLRVNLIDNFEEAIDFDILRPNTKHWQVRGSKIALELTPNIYTSHGIDIDGFEPNEIGVEAVARLLAIRNPSVFAADDIELHKSIPKELQKILVLDEWYHKDFNPAIQAPDEIEKSKPSSYETWDLLADVIERNDATLYKPTLKPNTHWSNYPDAGTY